MPFCGSCGAAMNPPAAFCPSCGARSEQTAAAQAVPVPVAPNAAVVKAGSSAKRVMRFAAIGFCALAILACAGYWAMNRSGSGGNAQMPGAGAVVGSGTDLTHAPGTIFDVTYTSNTVTVDPATTERTRSPPRSPMPYRMATSPGTCRFSSAAARRTCARIFPAGSTVRTGWWKRQAWTSPVKWATGSTQ